MPEAHKLAVILFADIAGYTAMMQEDESAALKVLNRFKEIVEADTPDHNGQVVQFFGDGALLSFDSSSNALACAVAMQEAFRSAPQVPVRIGMHLGDVLFKNGNAFGNGVNVASRVESLGIPGAVLMSKVIRDQVKNKGGYQLTSLGSFEFKNVEEATEVYALANPGFVVPRKSEMQGKLKRKASGGIPMKLIVPILALVIIGGIIWVNLTNNAQASDLLSEEIRQEKVAVAVFNNFTNDPNLDAFGNMASDWISAGLRELQVKTTSPEMMRRYIDRVGILPGNPDGEVSLLELTDAQYVVTGSYYQKGDSLQITSRLESTETGDNIYDFPALWGVVSKKEQLITEIREQLKGYWALKEADKLSTVNPPKYEAYQASLKCGLFQVSCYQKVLEIDSTFILVRMKLAYISQIQENLSLYQSSMNYVEKHWNRCTEFEKNFFSFVENQGKGNFRGALDAMNKNHQLDPKDLDILHHSAYAYLLLNQPAMTVKRFKPIFDQYETFKDQIRGQSITAYFLALNRLGQHKQVIKFSEKNPEWSNRKEVIRALMLEGDLQELRSRLDLKRGDIRNAHMFNALFPPDSANIFAPGMRANIDRYADPYHGWGYNVWSNAHLYNWDSKAFAYYQLKEWKQSEKILLGLRNMDWEANARGSIFESWLPTLNWHMDSWREGLLGCTYARQGETDLAHEQIELLESYRASFPGTISSFHRGVIPYWQARIHGVLGEKEQAVARLSQSKKEGMRTDYEKFVYDWDLVSLKGYEPYEELVRPN